MGKGEVVITRDLEQNNSSMSSKDTRISAFDLARGIAIIAMVVIHVRLFLGNPDLNTTIWAYISNMVICLLAAPVFSFIMGIMIGLSSNNSSKRYLHRGVVLLAIGYALNLLRGTIPTSIAGWFEWTYASWDGENPLVYLLEMDILQFAGLSLIVIALLKKIIPSDIGFAVMGGVVLLISPLLWDVSTQNPVLNYILSLFFGGNEYVFFPLFPWLAFPLFGVFYGAMLKVANNKKEFFIKSFYVGLVIIAGGIVAALLHPGDIIWDWLSGHYLQGLLPPAVSIVFLGFQNVWLSGCYFILKKVKENNILRSIFFWSKNVTVFYVIQWILLGWLVEIMPYLSLSGMIVTIIGVLIITDGVSKMWPNMRKLLRAN